eukprot:7697334-Heterocapsa_arctica.AAC.1
MSSAPYIPPAINSPADQLGSLVCPHREGHYANGSARDLEDPVPEYLNSFGSSQCCIDSQVSSREGDVWDFL